MSVIVIWCAKLRINAALTARPGLRKACGTVILTVNLNPALDITYHLEGIDWEGVNRPAQVRSRPGGKGSNVARTLRALGADVLVIGLAGGMTGEAVRSALHSAGVAASFTVIAGETRRTVAVVDTRQGTTALFSEPGPPVAPEEWERFLATYENTLTERVRRPGTAAASHTRCAAVVLTGSLPPGIPTDGYAVLTGIAASAGVPVVLDADGAVLSQGVRAGPAVVTPNLAELESAVGRTLSPQVRVVTSAARELMTAGAQAVVVSLGENGLVAVTGPDAWHVAPPRLSAGNPTGAGDAVAAGLAHGLVLGWGWPERLRHAAALGTATVAAPAAGEFGRDDLERALAGSRVTRVRGAGRAAVGGP